MGSKCSCNAPRCLYCPNGYCCRCHSCGGNNEDHSRCRQEHEAEQRAQREAREKQERKEEKRRKRIEQEQRRAEHLRQIAAKQEQEQRREMERQRAEQRRQKALERNQRQREVMQQQEGETYSRIAGLKEHISQLNAMERREHMHLTRRNESAIPFDGNSLREIPGAHEHDLFASQNTNTATATEQFLQTNLEFCETLQTQLDDVFKQHAKLIREFEQALAPALRIKRQICSHPDDDKEFVVDDYKEEEEISDDSDQEEGKSQQQTKSQQTTETVQQPPPQPTAKEIATRELKNALANECDLETITSTGSDVPKEVVPQEKSNGDKAKAEKQNVEKKKKMPEIGGEKQVKEEMENVKEEAGSSNQQNQQQPAENIPQQVVQEAVENVQQDNGVQEVKVESSSICKEAYADLVEYKMKVSSAIDAIKADLIKWKRSGQQFDQNQLEMRRNQCREKFMEIPKIRYVPRIVTEKETIEAILNNAEKFANDFSEGFRDEAQRNEFVSAISKAKEVFNTILESKHKVKNALLDYCISQCLQASKKAIETLQADMDSNERIVRQRVNELKTAPETQQHPNLNNIVERLKNALPLEQFMAQFEQNQQTLAALLQKQREMFEYAQNNKKTELSTSQKLGQFRGKFNEGLLEIGSFTYMPTFESLLPELFANILPEATQEWSQLRTVEETISNLCDHIVNNTQLRTLRITISGQISFPGQENPEQLAFEELLDQLGPIESAMLSQEDLEQLNNEMKPWLREFYQNLKEQSEEFEEWFTSEVDIQQWWEQQQEEFRRNGYEHGNEQLLQARLLAGIAKAAEIFFEFTPRDAQLLAIMARFYIAAKCPALRGAMLQVSTGEGKSLIIAMLAMLYQLTAIANGQRKPLISIVTCSYILAESDAQKMAPLFDLFGLTVDHVGHKNDWERLKEAYQRDITYGVLHDYLAHTAYDEFHKMDIRGGRKIDILINDEGDVTAIDDVTNQRELRLAFSAPGMECQNPIFTLVSFARNMLLSGCVKQTKKGEKTVLTAQQQREVENCLELPEDEESRLDSKSWMDRKPPKIRKIFHPFINDQKNAWAVSALQALAIEQNVQFLKRNIIMPVDNENSGIIEENTQWEAALQQFVQILQNTKLTPMTLQCAYKDNVSFLLDCPSVTLITGTAGTKTDHALVERLFNVTTQVIPRFKKRDYEQLDDLICNDQNEWKEAIMNEALSTAQNRAVMIVANSMKIASECYETLKKHPQFDDQKMELRKLIEGNPEESKDLEREMKPGHIMVATMLASRGIDMKLDKEVLTAGGLHVLNISPAQQARAEDQLFARAARKGEPGSGRSILLKTELVKVLGLAEEDEFTDEMLRDWRTRRDCLVGERQKNFEENCLPSTKFRGELYKAMCEKMVEVRELCDGKQAKFTFLGLGTFDGDAEKLLYAKSQFQEHWAFWIAKKNMEIQAQIEEGTQKQMNGKKVIESLKAQVEQEFHSFLDVKTRQLQEFITNPLNLGFFENPIYVTRTAHFYLEKQKQPEIAEQLLTRAYEMDPKFGAIPLYFRALARINISFGIFEKSGKRTSQNDELHRKAIEDLKEAKKLFEDQIHYIGGVQVLATSRPDCQHALQYGRILELLNCHLYECDKAIERIEDCDLNHPECVVKFEKYIPTVESYRKYNEQRKAEEEKKRKKVNDNNNNEHASLGGQKRVRKKAQFGNAVKRQCRGRSSPPDSDPDSSGNSSESEANNNAANNNRRGRGMDGRNPPDSDPDSSGTDSADGDHDDEAAQQEANGDEPVQQPAANSAQQEANGDEPAQQPGAQPAANPNQPALQPAAANPADEPDNAAPIPHEQIQQEQEAGMKHYYVLGIAAPQPSRWLILQIALLGALQFCVGCFLWATGVGSAGGWAMIESGLSDIAEATKRFFNESICGKAAEAWNWMNYLARKTIHYVKALVGFCMRELESKIPALKTVNKFFNNTEAPETKEIVKTILTRTFTPENVVSFAGERILDVVDPNPNLRKNLSMGVSVISGIVGTSVDICKDAKKFKEVNKHLFRKKRAGHLINLLGSKIATPMVTMKAVEKVIEKCEFGDGFWDELAKEGMRTSAEAVSNGVVRKGAEYVENEMHEHYMKTEPEYKRMMDFIGECEKLKISEDQAIEIIKKAKGKSNKLPSMEQLRKAREPMLTKMQKEAKKKHKFVARVKTRKRQQKSVPSKPPTKPGGSNGGQNGDNSGPSGGPSGAATTSKTARRRENNKRRDNLVDFYRFGVEMCLKKYQDGLNVQNLHATPEQLKPLYSDWDLIRKDFMKPESADKPGCSSSQASI